MEKRILRHPSPLAEGSGAIKAVTSERGILPPPRGQRGHVPVSVGQGNS